MANGKEIQGEKTKAQVFRERLLSTVALWVIVTSVFISMQAWAYFALILFLAAMGSWEFRKMLDGQPGKGCRTIGFLLGVLLLLVLWQQVLAGPSTVADFQVEGLGLVLTVLGGFCWRFRVGIIGRESINAVTDGMMTYVYVPLLFGAFSLRLSFLPLPVESAVPGAWLLLLMIGAAKFTDMGAYLTGSLIGKHKMAPKLSPGKTWEGFAGAIIFAQLAAWLVWFLADDELAWLSAPHVAALAFLIGVVAVAGDLSESVLKRSLGVKDSGKLMPGIGGVLDLVDSLCFAAPVTYFYLIFTGLV